MQEKLIQKYQKLEQEVEKIQLIASSIKNILADLLLAQDKSFEVVFNNNHFDFNLPTTQDEFNETIKKRDLLITMILKECFKDMVDGKDTWDYVLAFASGVDPLDMQIEIIGKQEHANQIDLNGKRITALPLDIETYQVKQEIEHDSQTQELA